MILHGHHAASTLARADGTGAASKADSAARIVLGSQAKEMDLTRVDL